MKKAFEDILDEYGLQKKDKYYLKLVQEKWELAKLFGGKCMQCGEEDLRVLCFHHIQGGIGSDEWRHMSRKERYAHIYAIVKSGKPRDIALLCMNCHTIEHSFPKRHAPELHRRFPDFLVDIKLRVMKIKKRLKATELPDGLMLLD